MRSILTETKPKGENAMKKMIAILVVMLMVGGTAFAMGKKPANEGSTVNVYVNNSSAQSEAFWACRNSNFKKASQLDLNGKVIAGTTDYAKMDELNKSCGSPV